MHVRWADRHRWRDGDHRPAGGRAGRAQERLDRRPGRGAYGWLRAERGVHRLVRISPFDAQNRRQTTFALVEVMPEPDEDAPIELDWDEIRVDTYRSQGAGGQHVNKTDSAVRLTHLPTGIVAQSQNERSQTQNKETAIKVLKARLLERALEEKEAELRKLRGEHVEAGWGNQIRAMSCTPTRWSRTSGPARDLEHGERPDGDLDAFMQAELERLATGGDEQDTGVIRRSPSRSVAWTASRTNATEADLPECSRIHRVGIDDYLVRMAFPMPVENPGLLRLHAHTLATDPTRFQVAERHGRGGSRGSSPSAPPWNAARCGSSRCSSWSPRTRPAASGGCSGADPPGGPCRSTTRPARTAPSRSRTASTPGRDRAPDAVPEPLGRPRAGWTPPPPPMAPPSRRRPRRTVLEPDVRAELDALDLEVNGWAHPQDHASTSASDRAAPGTAAPAADSSATATPRRWAGLGPSPSATRPCCSRSSPTFSPRSRRAAPRPSGWRPRGGGDGTAFGPACDSRAFRSSPCWSEPLRGLHQIRTNVTRPHLIGPLVAFWKRVANPTWSRRRACDRGPAVASRSWSRC